MSEPSISVLCVTHGRPQLLAECLKSCVSQHYPNFDILVVLNPADDASERAVRAAAPNARIIRAHRNLGFFPALNLALANTKADYIMIVDDDARFLDAGALAALVDQFRREPVLGAVTCNLEGPFETPITGGDRYIRTFTTGFTMMPRRVVTEWVEYFPDIFFRSAGETFLCTTLWDQRRPIKRVERVRMHHALASEGRSRRDFLLHALRSQLLCAVMREPGAWLLPVLASKFGKSFMFYLRENALSIWMCAWLSFLFNLPAALRFRRPISHVTRRLLHRLDREVVRDLDQCPEWVDTAAAAPVKT
jgi:GT2 family glycosyltransferase